MALLAARGVNTGASLAAFLAPLEEQVHDPALLPDAAVALARIRRACGGDEKVLVYGDFDADGLSGLSILVVALRALGLDVAPYVPERIGDGHGLSLRAIERAAAEGRTLIVTADCGTSSEPEMAIARSRGIEVIVTDHHHAPQVPASAVAVVNPQRADSAYPEKGLTGAGVAWKVAHLLLRDAAGDTATWPLPPLVAALADLAVIGTVGDVAPILGENRAIARLGLERLREDPRPGLAALLDRARMKRSLLDLEDVAFGLAPRLNAAGRVGEAERAARLLMTEEAAEATALADEIEEANRRRRDVTKSALKEARRILRLPPPPDADEAEAVEPVDVPDDAPLQGELELPVTGSLAGAEALPAAGLPAALLLRGEWPVGIIGLIAGRLAEDYSRPVIVATTLDAEAGTLRASCRSGKALNLAESLVECSELLIRHGGHEAAAGFDIHESSWESFAARFLELAEARALPPPAPELTLDLVLSADAVDFGFVKEIGLLEPTGPGNPRPILGLTGLRVVRARAANGGHSQVVLRRSRDVLDCIAFRRPDLASSLKEGDLVDVVARASVRAFGGLETVQLEVLDVADAGSQLPFAAPTAATASR